MELADIIRPITLDEFKNEFYGKAYLRVSGQPSRFAHLVPWSDLNEVVSRIRADNGRINVVRNGKKIGGEEYLIDSSNSRSGRVNALALERRLRLGDSLVVNAVHELFPELEETVDSITATCRVPAGANLYAGFKRWKGFDLHFDKHDTLIVQIHGQKSWQVWEPTTAYPFSTDRPQDMVKPTKEPVWQGLLESGDVLYMPRGWWHVAEPVDGPSVHVTFSIPQPTSLDLIAWMLDDLKEMPAARRPLPVFGSPDERERFAQELGEALAQYLKDDVVERYFHWQESRITRRRALTLPTSVVETTALDSTIPLVLVDSRSLVFRHLSEREIGFWAARRFWRCDVALKTALEGFEDRDGHSMDELDARVPAPLKSFFRIFVRTLTEAGALMPMQATSVEPDSQDLAETIASPRGNG
jgi:hypothetical protein